MLEVCQWRLMVRTEVVVHIILLYRTTMGGLRGCVGGLCHPSLRTLTERTIIQSSRVGNEVTTYVGQMVHLQARIIECVNDASESGWGCVYIVDCHPFPAGELDLDCVAF